MSSASHPPLESVAAYHVILFGWQNGASSLPAILPLFFFIPSHQSQALLLVGTEDGIAAGPFEWNVAWNHPLSYAIWPPMGKEALIHLQATKCLLCALGLQKGPRKLPLMFSWWKCQFWLSKVLSIIRLVMWSHNVTFFQGGLGINIQHMTSFFSLKASRLFLPPPK